MDPQEISSSLAISPILFWKVGALHKSPKGTLLGGAYDHSYWVDRLPEHETCADLAGTIERYLIRLEGKAEFMHVFFKTGGTAEIYIGWFSPGGETFASDILERLASLHIDLGIDVYRNEPVESESPV